MNPTAAGIGLSHSLGRLSVARRLFSRPRAAAPVRRTAAAHAALLLAGAFPLLAARASAQLPPAHSGVLATAYNYTALARGFSAVALNPAALGLPENPAFSLALLPVVGSQTLDPVTLSDVADYGGRLIPAGIKAEWLQRIASAEGEEGAATMGATGFAFNGERFGLQLSTIASLDASLTEAAAELLLFGNAGRTGTPGDFDLRGSQLQGFAVSTLALSAGFPVNLKLGPWPRQSFALGLTLKRSWGHALLMGEDVGTVATSDPLRIEVELPVIHTRSDAGLTESGTGLGLDAGAAWEAGPWAAAVVVRNVFNTFEWDLESLSYRPGEALFNGTTNDSDFDERPAAQAPEALRSRVAELTFKPEVVWGGAFRPTDRLAFTAEARKRFGQGLEPTPEAHFGVGLEYRAAPFLPVRAGLALITEGFRAAGGFGIALGPVHIGIGAMLQRGGAGDSTTGMVALSYGAG